VSDAGNAGAGSSRNRVLWLSFVESFGTILLERAIYFFSHERLGYSEAQNLGLALAFGVTYTFGAALSHAVSARLGERRALGLIIFGLLLVHLVIAAVPLGWVLALGFAVVGLLEGAKWPIIESYVGAGLEPAQQLRAVGRFNVSWALAVPLAIGVAGPLIALGHPGALFALAAFANVLALALLLGLPRTAAHLEATHPSRPLALAMDRYRALLASSRWSMLSSYALLFLVAPLLPDVFGRLGRSVEQATLWASCLDAVRVLTFALLATLPGWHGRPLPLLLGALGLPLGFAAIVFGNSLWVVVAGELVFGVMAGVTYYAALYYAMVVKNASVDAGGAHERLIGLGLVLGPGLGLIGHQVARAGGSYLMGILVGAGPLVLLCWFGSLRSLLRVRVA
jgi:predicted MFS family arabinose efflux permease